MSSNGKMGQVFDAERRRLSMENQKQRYLKPEILATYSKEELEEAIRPHGSTDSYTDYGSCSGGGCGCGGGAILIN
jgi:hypothetical protein